MSSWRAWLHSREGWGRAAAVAVYAAAMGYAEAAAVIYIRLLHGGVDPMARALTQPIMSLVAAEVGREAATIVMLTAVAALAGRGWAGRCGSFLLAFGVWDLTYYVFLALLSGWPASPLDWDVLFLIPLPWWGPVLTPALIAAMMVVSGAVLLLREAAGDAPAFDARAVAIGAGGALVCLVAFMADAIASILVGEPPPRRPSPSGFNWMLYGVGYAALARGMLGSALTRSGDGRAAEPAGAGAQRGAAPTEAG
jgi:hypothetical protein